MVAAHLRREEGFWLAEVDFGGASQSVVVAGQVGWHPFLGSQFGSMILRNAIERWRS